MSKKLTRRKFIKILGAGAASVAGRRLMPLPVDMSEQYQAQASETDEQELVTEKTEWIHPCTGKPAPDIECGCCHFYFCPPAYRMRNG